MNFDAHINDSESDYNNFVDWLSETTQVQLRQAGADEEQQRPALYRYFQLGYNANLTPSELWDFLSADDGCIFDGLKLSDDDFDILGNLAQRVSQQVLEKL